MAAGWSVMDALNKSSKAAVEDTPKARFRTRDISIRKMYSNVANFYGMEGIDKLAQEILAVGLLQNMVVAYEPCDRGEYKIIAGERRWRALTKLLESGYSEFEIVTCQIKDTKEEHEETVQLIMANAYRDKSMMDILEEERRLKESLQYMKENNIPLSGYKLDSGRLRDVIADIMNTTGTKIAQIESINHRLIPEFVEEIKEGRLTFSAAYELSGMDEERQQEMLTRYRETGLTWSEVKKAKLEAEKAAEGQQIKGQMQFIQNTDDTDNIENSEWQDDNREDLAEQDEEDESTQKPGDDWTDAHPEGITSLCYSCTEYETCNVKTGTCTKCDKYRNRQEAYKTEEQQYAQEQAAIDRETKRKLREQEEANVSLPSEEMTEKKCIKVPRSTFQRMVDNQQSFLIVQNQKFHIGEEIMVQEYAEGKATGRVLELFISYMEDDSTSSVIEEGYCVIETREAYRFCDQCEYFDKANIDMAGCAKCKLDKIIHHAEEEACDRFERRKRKVERN